MKIFLPSSISLVSSPAKALFLSTALLGTIIAASSSSWLTCWIGLELNLLSFIPILSSSSNLYKSEAALKYFLIQALGSVIILCSGPALIIFKETPELIILLAILLKLGASPLHFWLPSIMQGLPWPQCYILITIQKVAPLLIITYLSPLNYSSWLIFIASSLSALVGGLAGLNQTLIRKLMAYSSINHLGWILAALSFSKLTLVNYFLIYCLTTASVVVIIHSRQIFHLNHISSSRFKKAHIKISFFLALFSMGGLPPFLGFFPKLLVILTLTNQGHYIWLTVLLFSALLTLFFYIRMATSAMILSTPKIKFKIKTLSTRPYLSLVLVRVNFLPILGPFVTIPPL